MHLLGGVDEMAEHHVACVGARPSAGLEDDRCIDGRGRSHHRQHLLHVVDVERGHAVAVLRRVVQQLAQRDASHQ
jgi:hypothetical protein